MTDKRIEELQEKAKRLSEHDVPILGWGLYVEAITLAESLAAELEAIRGAGDEEVEDHIKTVKCLWHMLPEFSYAVNMLRDIAISRGQQLAAALKRVKELEEMLRLREMSGIDGEERTDD